MRNYVEDREKYNIKKKIKYPKLYFWKIYICLDPYGDNLNKRYIFYHKDIQFINNEFWYLIGTHDEPGGTSNYNEIFSIYEYLFDRIRIFYQKNNIESAITIKAGC